MPLVTPSSPATHPPWLRLGFRPFFLAAGLFAVLAVTVWFLSWTLGWRFAFDTPGAITWHGHEMVFGYAMAVVAGFLLTAVGNWTGKPTLRGWPLALLLGCWLTARVLWLAGGGAYLVVAAGFDLLFGLLLLAAIGAPVVRAEMWSNLAIVAKVALIVGSNLVFYLGAAGQLEQGIFLGLYSGLYLIIALILTMGRRVVPFFIERGVEQPVQLRNSKAVDLSSLLLFLAFWLAELGQPNGALAAWLALALFALHLWRLAGWYTRQIWRKPLLWVLYLGYAAIVAGFALKAAVYFAGTNPSLALHAFAYGGIGMMTLGMMARVTLGHTGRNVFEPPRGLGPLFGLLLAGALARVALPGLLETHYRLWIALSQWLWIAAFAGFVLLFAPMLLRARVDGRDG
jgi:uncharacterized protein involved in response to NO